MLADAFGHAQLVHVEHAYQVVARLGGKYHGLRRKYRRKSPHVRALLDFGESCRIVGVARLHAVHYGRREFGAHETDFGGRPRRYVVGVAADTHADIRAAIALAQDHGQLGYGDERHRVHEVHDLARCAAFFGFGANLETRRVDEHHDRDVERIAQHQEVHYLAARVRVERAAAMQGIVGDDAHTLAAQARETDRCTLAEA